ncbi:peptidoglycan-binding protein [Streptomyces sp. NPDC051452]|uniref:peptidoglycan-binding protein n=1 Tax=Streptomyces sp. NPDC051452 TaxID=3365654 RepID=UPI0037B346BD
MVSLSNVQFGMTNDEVKTLQSALIHAGFDIPAGATGQFGPQTKSAYADWQKSIGFTGSDANGFPGCTSLTKLGARAGFDVDCRNHGSIAKSFVQYTTNSGIASNEETARTFALEACEKTGAPKELVTGVSNGANLLTLINRESSFIANAVNQKDMNATGPRQVDGARLNCSRGYAQVIPGTFAEHHQAGTANRIYDPVANIAASINYIWSRYGDISRVQQANPNLPPHPY